MGKLRDLADNWGFDSIDDLLEESSYDSVVPGICTNKGCSYTTDVEPDCYDGFCEICGTQTVRSALALAGII